MNKLLYPEKRRSKTGPTEIRTRVSRIKTYCDNHLHYRTCCQISKINIYKPHTYSHFIHLFMKRVYYFVTYSSREATKALMLHHPEQRPTEKNTSYTHPAPWGQWELCGGSSDVGKNP